MTIGAASGRRVPLVVFPSVRPKRARAAKSAFGVNFPDDALVGPAPARRRHPLPTRRPSPIHPRACVGDVQQRRALLADRLRLRKAEARLNALPQFVTEIDGLDIISFTFARSMKTRCRSSSRTGGPARSSSS